MENDLIKEKLAEAREEPVETPDEMPEILPKKVEIWNGLELVYEFMPGECKFGNQVLTIAYGYIRSHMGVDNMELDCYIGENLSAREIYKVYQIDIDGNFDEYKFMIGFDSIDDAKRAYEANVPGYMFGAIQLSNLAELEAFRSNPGGVMGDSIKDINRFHNQRLKEIQAIKENIKLATHKKLAAIDAEIQEEISKKETKRKAIEMEKEKQLADKIRKEVDSFDIENTVKTEVAKAVAHIKDSFSDLIKDLAHLTNSNNSTEPLTNQSTDQTAVVINPVILDETEDIESAIETLSETLTEAVKDTASVLDSFTTLGIETTEISNKDLSLEEVKDNNLVVDGKHCKTSENINTKYFKNLNDYKDSASKDTDDFYFECLDVKFNNSDIGLLTDAKIRAKILVTQAGVTNLNNRQYTAESLERSVAEAQQNVKDGLIIGYEQHPEPVYNNYSEAVGFNANQNPPLFRVVKLWYEQGRVYAIAEFLDNERGNFYAKKIAMGETVSVSLRALGECTMVNEERVCEVERFDGFDIVEAPAMPQAKVLSYAFFDSVEKQSVITHISCLDCEQELIHDLNESHKETDNQGLKDKNTSLLIENNRESPKVLTKEGQISDDNKSNNTSINYHINDTKINNKVLKSKKQFIGDKTKMYKLYEMLRENPEAFKMALEFYKLGCENATLSAPPIGDIKPGTDQEITEGVTPTSEGVTPTSEGVTPTSEGVTPTSERVAPTKDIKPGIDSDTPEGTEEVEDKFIPFKKKETSEGSKECKDAINLVDVVKEKGSDISNNTIKNNDKNDEKISIKNTEISLQNINNNINNLEKKEIMDANNTQDVAALLARMQSMFEASDAKEQQAKQKQAIVDFVTRAIEDNAITSIDLNVLSANQIDKLKTNVLDSADTVDEARKMLRSAAKSLVDAELTAKQNARLNGLRNGTVGRTIEHVVDDKSWMEYYEKMDKSFDINRKRFRKRIAGQVDEYSKVNEDYVNTLLADYDSVNAEELAKFSRDQKRAIKDREITDAAVVVANSDFKNQPIIARVMIKQVFQRLTTMQLVQGLGPGSALGSPGPGGAKFGAEFKFPYWSYNEPTHNAKRYVTDTSPIPETTNNIGFESFYARERALGFSVPNNLRQQLMEGALQIDPVAIMLESISDDLARAIDQHLLEEHQQTCDEFGAIAITAETPVAGSTTFNSGGSTLITYDGGAVTYGSTVTAVIGAKPTGITGGGTIPLVLPRPQITLSAAGSTVTSVIDNNIIVTFPNTSTTLNRGILDANKQIVREDPLDAAPHYAVDYERGYFVFNSSSGIAANGDLANTRLNYSYVTNYVNFDLDLAASTLAEDYYNGLLNVIAQQAGAMYMTPRYARPDIFLMPSNVAQGAIGIAGLFHDRKSPIDTALNGGFAVSDVLGMHNNLTLMQTNGSMFAGDRRGILFQRYMVGFGVQDPITLDGPHNNMYAPSGGGNVQLTSGMKWAIHTRDVVGTPLPRNSSGTVINHPGKTIRFLGALAS